MFKEQGYLSPEEWTKVLSDKQRTAYTTAENYRRLKNYAGTGFVTFDDTFPPHMDGGDPYRRCLVNARILEAGQDHMGPWVLLDVTAHRIQRISEESVAPGFHAFFHQLLASKLLSLTDVDHELQEFRAIYPQTDQFVDLPLPDEPQQFYVQDMEYVRVSLRSPE